MKLLADLWHDLRYGVRLLAKNRRLTAAVVLTLAVGIGANSLVFSVVRSVLIRQLEYDQPERLVQLWQSGLGGGGRGDWASFPNFRDWSSENRVFDDMAAYRFSPLTVSGDGEAESMLGLEATDRLFGILGVKPILGRAFDRGEDEPGHENVAVISHSLWQRRYGGNPGVIGKPVNVDGKPYTIIGVMPAPFHFPSGLPGEAGAVQVEMWIPMRQSPEMAQRGSHNFWVVARLKAGVTLDEARANLQNIAANLARQYPASNKDLGVVVTSLRDYVTGNVRPALLLLLAAVSVLLLLACSNIANLLLSFAESRRREMAVRAAIGASRARLIRQSLIESAILSLLGAGAGLVIASFGLDPLIRWIPSTIPRIEQTSIDRAVILFTGVTAAAAGLLFGLAPALLGSHRNIHESIKQSASNTTAGRTALTVRHAVSNAKAGRRFQTLLLAIFAALGVFLASTGIYGVTAYDVSRRTREIGVRLALGAQPSSVIAMVLKRELRMVGIGILAGLIGAVALSSALNTFLFGVTPLDAVTFGLVIGAVALVSIAATYLPGRWAAAIDPTVLCRHE